MAGFVYFFERLGSVSLMEEHGLGDRLVHPMATEVGSDAGPHGLTGTIVSDWQVTPTSGLTWVKPDQADWWLGWNEHSPPGPADLDRDLKGCDVGAWVELRDKNKWWVPMVLPCTDRDPTRKSGLPYKVPQLKDGNFDYVESPDWKDIVAEASRIWEFLKTADDSAFLSFDVFNFCVYMLSICYRIGAPEVLALQLLDSSVANRIAIVAFDFVERLTLQEPSNG